MTHILAVLAFLILAAGSMAQEVESNTSFSDAWNEYVNAPAYGGPIRTMVAARIVLEIAERTLPSWDVRFPMLMDNYGVALMDAGEIESASDILEEAITRSEEIHGPDSEEPILMLMHYADSCAEFGNLRTQEKYYKLALNIGDKQYGKKSNEYADILLSAGYRILDLSRTKSGLKNLKKPRESFVNEQGGIQPCGSKRLVLHWKDSRGVTPLQNSR